MKEAEGGGLQSKGIVAPLHPLRGGGQILDLYTRDAGLISAIAKGIRLRSPASEPAWNRSPAWTSSPTTAVRSHRDPAETLRSFHGVREDLARSRPPPYSGSVRALSGGDEADAASSSALQRPR